MSFERTNFFISYRHTDGEIYAEKIRQKLKLTEPSCKVYLDKYEMVGASSFIYQIKQELEKAELFILLITPFWNTNEGKKKLHKTQDILHREVSFALRNHKPILPILIEGALMPEESYLPEDIFVLHHIHAVKLNSATFDKDFNSIINTVILVLAEAKRQDERRDKRMMELNKLMKADPEKFRIEFQKEFDLVKDQIPTFLPVKSVSGKGIKESEVNLYGTWKSVTHIGTNKFIIEYIIMSNNSHSFTGKIVLKDARGNKLKKNKIKGTWTKAMDIDKDLLLGFFLSFIDEDENHQEIIIPFHQKVGKSLIGTNSDGTKFVSTNISPYIEGF